MPLLIINETGRAAKVFKFVSPPGRAKARMIIGRSKSADLVLPNVSVSRNHAEITIASGRIKLRRLSPTNSVLVNGEEVEEIVLESGFTIRLGKYRLTFLEEAEIDPMRLQQIQELAPYLSVADRRDPLSTHAITPHLREKLLEQEALRERGALKPADDPSKWWLLGVNPVEIGPDRAIPSSALFGSAIQATIAWGGAAHHVKKVSMLARVKINGDSVREADLCVGDALSVNGTEFTYALVPKKG